MKCANCREEVPIDDQPLDVAGDEFYPCPHCGQDMFGGKVPVPKKRHSDLAFEEGPARIAFKKLCGKSTSIMQLVPGQVVRCDAGPTGLALVKSVYGNHGYGEHCLGGGVGFWADDCTLATRADIERAKTSSFWALGDI